VLRGTKVFIFSKKGGEGEEVFLNFGYFF